MSLFLDSDGTGTGDITKVRYTLIAISKFGNTIRTKDRMTLIQPTGSCQQQIRIFGENINSYSVKYEENIYWYVDVEEVNYLKPSVSAYVGGMLTGNLRGYISCGLRSYYNDMYALGLKAEKASKHFRYIYKLNKIKQKISQNHHFHVRLYDLYKRAEKIEVDGHEALLLRYLDKFTDVEITHVTFVTYYRSVDLQVRRIFLGMIMANEGIDMEWLKEEGKAAKQSSVLMNVEFSQLYELNVLTNRIDTVVDWQQEKINREKPVLAQVEPHQVYNHAITLFTLAKREGKKPLLMSYEEYWRQRAVAMPSGAIHDEDPKLEKIIKTLPREVKNKKGLASALPFLEQSFFLDKKREIHSYTSTKYEWGKTRALYGCDFTSHVNADFGLLACEETFPFFVPTGRHANAEFISKVMKPYSRYIPVCYDYEDFNSQHSSQNMQQVLRAWRDVYYTELTDEQIKSLEWTIDSITAQFVHDKQHNYEYMTAGTLFSGWRLTSFMNTALNYCYLAQAGINKTTSLHMHNGDDVFATVDNLYQALKLYTDAKQLGIRANMTKMSIGTIAEFLRTDMRAGKASNRQYLTRGVSTFTHSRIESGAPASYRNVVEAYKTRYEEVIMRGAENEFISKLYRKQLFFARNLFNVKKEDQVKMLTYDRTCGGLADNGVIVDEQIIEVSLTDKTLTEQELRTYISNGVNDYTTYIASQFPQFRNEVTKNTVYNSILNSYNVNMKTIKIVEAEPEEKRHMRAMRGAWAKMDGIALINRVRMGVSNILVILRAVNSERARSLEKVNDPIAWLAILLKAK